MNNVNMKDKLKNVVLISALVLLISLLTTTAQAYLVQTSDDRVTLVCNDGEEFGWNTSDYTPEDLELILSTAHEICRKHGGVRNLSSEDLYGYPVVTAVLLNNHNDQVIELINSVIREEGIALLVNVANPYTNTYIFKESINN